MNGNIVTYAETALDTFEEREFCSVDSLILSWVSYFHMKNIVSSIRKRHWGKIPVAQLFRAEYFEEMFCNLWDNLSSRRLLTALAASPRFRNIQMLGYTEQFDAAEEKQFAAVCFQITPDLCYVAFRGTDSTLVEWKEDFNMAFKCPVPSQKTAVRYLTDAARHCRGKILVGGHSKGGNLAVYAAVKCSEDIQKRIERVYSHDGPGFLEEILQRNDFLRICPKIEKTLPQSSVIGMLLEHQENFQIVESARISFWQHDPFSWIVDNGSFHYISRLTSDARYLNKTVNAWLGKLNEAERERFVDSLCGVLNTNDIATVGEWKADWTKNVSAAIHAAAQLDSDTKTFLLHTLRELAALSVKNLKKLS